ncbi:feruloyl-CoA synthase [compost metagenome]
MAACQGLAPELAGLPARDLVVHPLVVDALRRKLQAQDEGPVSGQVRRVLLMADAPSPDANEIADKGYINQAMARQRRAHLIEPLYAEPAHASVAVAH